MKLWIAFLFVIVAMVGAQHEHHHLEEYIDYQAHPHYNYHYGVHDPKHHDVKDQWEARDGHKTKGAYSLLQPDGRKRIVEYEADKHGIHYKVKFEGHAIHEEGHSHGGGGDGGHGGHGGGGGGHGHGHSISSQYYHGASNYAGEIHGHHGGEGGGGGHGGHSDGGHGGQGGGGEGHGHGGHGGGGGGGGDSGYGGGHDGGSHGGHGHAVSYSTHITHPQGHGHGHHH